MGDIALETQGLSKHFEAVRAADGVNLQVHRGEIFGFLGPNGAGKTTTINMMLGLLRSTAGQVLVFGQKVTPHHVKPLWNVGSLVGAPAMVPNLFRDNVIVGERKIMRKINWKLVILGGIPGAIALAMIVLAVRNMGLPTQSSEIARLSELEKARLREMFHLRETLGDAVWPGWAEATIPVIVYNEAYAFLLGYPGEPPDGWVKVPRNEHRGGPWEVVPSDTFRGQPYYRQPLPDPNRTPENFTVLVGDQWVATLQTREYSEVAFYQGFRKDLPKFLRPIFPYRLVWNLLIDSSETYIGAIAHEAFHAYQGITAPERLTASERVAPLEDAYPWDNEILEHAWGEESDLLYQAVTASSDADAAELARQFLAQREARRAETGMTSQLVEYERQREWLEGLAKYAELSIGLAAGRAADYQPIPAIQDDPAFKHYATRERFWSAQLGEIRRLKNRSGETRFYYVGMAQAILLDRLMPDWKSRVWDDAVWLDALLAEAVED